MSSLISYLLLAVTLGAGLALTACEPAQLASTPDAAPPAVREDASSPVEAADARVEQDAAPSADAGSVMDASISSAPSADAGPGAALFDATPGDAQLPLSGDASNPDAAITDAGLRTTDFAVGTTHVEFSARGNRKLTLQIWYPAVEAARAEAHTGHPMSGLEPPGPRRALLDRLLPNAPEKCTNRTMHAAIGASPVTQASPFPLLVYSHHLEGMRVSLVTLAEHLARLGFVVAGPDHTPWTLYDRSDDLATADLLATGLRFDATQVATRAEDISSVIDLMLDANAELVPTGLRGKIDPARVGMFGHSLGSITAGVVTPREPRIKAVAFIAFPPAPVLSLINLLEQPPISAFKVPALFMLAQEDGPLNTAGGNDAMRSQFDAYPEAAYLVELRDTGHWSFADDCALIPDFADGCGKATRSSGRSAESFENLDNARAREIVAGHLGTFFSSRFLGQPDSALKPGETALELVRAHGARDAGPP